MNPGGDPVEEIIAYAERKLAMAQEYPRESRLFANEILQGAPRILPAIEGELKDLVDTWAAQVRTWAAEGRIRPVDPYHLIFSIWALTQHYADFDVQVSAVMGEAAPGRFKGAEAFLRDLFDRLLTPE